MRPSSTARPAIELTASSTRSARHLRFVDMLLDLAIGGLEDLPEWMARPAIELTV